MSACAHEVIDAAYDTTSIERAAWKVARNSKTTQLFNAFERGESKVKSDTTSIFIVTKSQQALETRCAYTTNGAIPVENRRRGKSPERQISATAHQR